MLPWYFKYGSLSLSGTFAMEWAVTWFLWRNRVSRKRLGNIVSRCLSLGAMQIDLKRLGWWFFLSKQTSLCGSGHDRDYHSPEIGDVPVIGLATYYGARLDSCDSQTSRLVIIVRQKGLNQRLKLQKKSVKYSLMAPTDGVMNRLFWKVGQYEILLTLIENGQTIFRQTGFSCRFWRIQGIVRDIPIKNKEGNPLTSCQRFAIMELS